jgi:type IV pilus assembly protein PilE
MKLRGFTLPELLVTLTIVGILTAIAWPSYSAVMRRAQRDDARLALLGIQYAEELRYQNAHAYSDRLADSTALGGLGLAERSAAGSYQLAVTLRDDGQRYVASARPLPQGRQAADRSCALLSIDETGRRGAVDADGRDTTTLCWG